MTSTLTAHVVAAPVLGRRGSARVLYWGRTAGYLELDGFAVAVTVAGAPLLPNGICVTARTLPGTTGRTARVTPSGIVALGASVTWERFRPTVWDAAAPAPALIPADVFRRGRAILRRLRDASSLTVDASALWTALASRNPERVATASGELAGLGPGLTPEGDDLLAAAAAAVYVFGDACNVDPPVLDSLRPQSLGRRTTSLSATLLDLALEGRVLEPAGRLLDVRDPTWRVALERLLRIGHSTGYAYAHGIGRAAVALAEKTIDPRR